MLGRGALADMMVPLKGPEAFRRRHCRCGLGMGAGMSSTLCGD